MPKNKTHSGASKRFKLTGTNAGPGGNGRKVRIALEEMGLAYEVEKIDILAGEQQRPDFLAISPNGRIPGLVDTAADGERVAIFESGAILQYLGRKSDLKQGLRGVRDRESGMALNAVRERLEAAFDAREAELERAELDQSLTGEKVDVPLLIIHGDDDQIVPIGFTSARTAELVRKAPLKVYAGAPHGLMVTHRDQIHADLLEFIGR